LIYRGKKSKEYAKALWILSSREELCLQGMCLQECVCRKDVSRKDVSRKDVSRKDVSRKDVSRFQHIAMLKIPNIHRCITLNPEYSL